MAKSFKEIKLQNRDRVVFIRKGLFYDTYYGDAYLVSKFTNYRVSSLDYKLGFPSSVLSKVINILLDNSISVIVFDGTIYKEYNAINNLYMEKIKIPFGIYKAHKAVNENIDILRNKVLSDFTKYSKLKDFVESL